MKAANVLITKNGVLKLADFGLARAFSAKNGHSNRYTNRVVTLWYRPPELLLGDRNYGPPVDLWGAGCIMAEMWTRFTLFYDYVLACDFCSRNHILCLINLQVSYNAGKYRATTAYIDFTIVWLDNDRGVAWR